MQPDRHELFGGGIYRLMASNNPEFPPDALWDAYNMVYERASEDPEKMQGYTRLGTNTVNGAVSGLFDYAEGTELIATSEDGGIYKRTTGDWAAVTGGAAATFSTTSGVRWSGTMFYGATTGANLLILCNSAATNAPQKYTSSAGVSALGGGWPTDGQYPVAFGGRLWMAAGSTLYYSAADDAETVGGSFLVNSPGNITGLYNYAGNLLIFKKQQILRLLPGTTLVSTSIRDLTSRIGTPSHYTVQETTGTSRAGTLFLMSYEGIHEIIPTSATGGFYVTNSAEGIKPILDRRDTANLGTCWATYNPTRGEYWLQYTLNDNSPDEGVIGNVARGKKVRWTLHDMRNKTAGCMYFSGGAQIQVVGNASGTVFQLHDGTYARDTAGGYRGFITTPSLTQGDRSRMKVYGRTFLDAATNGTYPVLAYSSLGRAGLPTPGGNTNQPSGFGAVDGWGVGTWGQATWGGSTTNGQWFRPAKVRRGSYIRWRFETLGADQWFRINGLTQEYSLRRAILAA